MAGLEIPTVHGVPSACDTTASPASVAGFIGIVIRGADAHSLFAVLTVEGSEIASAAYEL